MANIRENFISILAGNLNPGLSYLITTVKNFCACTKTKFTEWKSSFGEAQHVWDRHKICINFWSGPEHLDL